MKELLDLSFTTANLLPTICLLLVLVYWLVFLVGLIDLTAFDIEVGHDGDLELSHDLETGDIGDSGEIGFSAKLLGFFNFGAVPVMVIFSFFSLFFWAMSILGNHYLAAGNWLLTVAILIAALLGAAVLAKLITQPMRAIFKKFNDEEQPIDLRGKACEIEVGPEAERLGQATLRIGDKNLNIYVRSDSKKRIPQGTICVILERNENEDSYLVAPMDA